jgi:uncharacterized protein (TIGR02231 family)
MKQIFCVAILCTSLLSAHAQTSEKEVKSEIKAVTVFLKGAQVTRKANVTISSGNSELTFVGLSPQIDKNSIQVKGDNNFTITSVNHQMNYLDKGSTSPEVQRMEDTLQKLEFDLRLKSNLRKVFEEEKSMILSNKAIGGEEGVNIEDLIDLAGIYRSRIKEINAELVKSRKEEKELGTKVQKVRQQLRVIRGENRKNTSEVVVKISSKTKVTTNLEVSYLVYNAGWTPYYDVRSSDIDGPVELTYKGNVYQNSGNDWDNINITLSSGNPTQSGTLPTVNPWVLDYEENLRVNRWTGAVGNGVMLNSAYDQAAPVIEESIEEYDYEKKAVLKGYITAKQETSKSLANYTTVAQSNVNTEFKVKVPYSIPTDGIAYAVEIQKYDLPVKYLYYAAPKYDKDAFLLAKVSGWDEYNLLSGSAGIYYQGTFVGKSFINTNVTEDTLDISMGRDKSIVIDRKKIKDFNKTTTVGTSKKSTVGIEITVRNNKNKTIFMDIEDQVPISRVKEIEVELVESSDASFNESTGRLTWSVILGPGESRSFQFKYQVKYPKEQTIANL